jgi:hypothetical protein
MEDRSILDATPLKKHRRIHQRNIEEAKHETITPSTEQSTKTPSIERIRGDEQRTHTSKAWGTRRKWRRTQEGSPADDHIASTQRWPAGTSHHLSPPATCEMPMEVRRAWAWRRMGWWRPAWAPWQLPPVERRGRRGACAEARPGSDSARARARAAPFYHVRSFFRSVMVPDIEGIFYFFKNDTILSCSTSFWTKHS